MVQSSSVLILMLSIEAARAIPQLIAYPDLPNPARMKERSSLGSRSKCPGMIKTVLQVQGVSNTAADNSKLSWNKIQTSDENIQYVINNIVNNKKINYKKVEREKRS